MILLSIWRTIGSYRWPIRSCISAHFSKFLLYQDVLLNDICQFVISDTQNIVLRLLKSVSMRKPGRTRQGVIMLKSPISLKLGTNVRYQELTYVTEFQVKILNSLGDPGIPCKNRHFARFMHN